MTASRSRAGPSPVTTPGLQGRRRRPSLFPSWSGHPGPHVPAACAPHGPRCVRRRPRPVRSSPSDSKDGPYLVPLRQRCPDQGWGSVTSWGCAASTSSPGGDHSATTQTCPSWMSPRRPCSCLQHPSFPRLLGTSFLWPIIALRRRPRRKNSGTKRKTLGREEDGAARPS